VKGGLRVLAVVPARGGTDTVPYLNLKRLGDKPLLAHTLDAARKAPSLDRVVVSTDDDRLAEIASSYGAEAPFRRPADLVADIPSLKPVILHAVEAVEAGGDRFDVVVVLQATSPFREGGAIEEALDRLVTGGFDAVISVDEDRTLAWKQEGDRLVPLFEREGRREEQPPVYRENGAVVVLRRAVVDGPTRFGERVGHLVLDRRAAFTVHDLADFWMAERLLREPRVLFRADGGAALGMGHVFRSLAIADALREQAHADVAFLMSAELPDGIRTVSRHGYPVRAVDGSRPEDFLEHVRDFAPSILINDLRTLPADYLRALSHLGTTTVNLVDTPGDLETTEHYEQLIVSVMKEDRETPEGFYAGPEYAILREQFRGRVKEVREQARQVLLSFGGSDPQGLTLLAARALMPLPAEVELLAVTGPAFAFHRELEEALSSAPGRVRVVRDASGHIAELMLEADVMVGSGGMSVYEIAALGTPGVILAQNAREDERMREFARLGTVAYLGLGTDVAEGTLREAVSGLLRSPGDRRAMSARGRALVDGLGAVRAADAVLASHRERTAPLGGR
jgi:spore coat polysaccharide biosynthesis predicted glycosyltransferase SpsG/CMP-N-acetylneuraminic acid synthetase